MSDLFLSLAAGGGVGYFMYHVVGCPSGGCFLTGNPYTAVLYGALAGLLLAVSR